MRYAVVIEKGPASFGAYVPDLPGCVAVAKTAAQFVSHESNCVVGSVPLRKQPIPFFEIVPYRDLWRLKATYRDLSRLNRDKSRHGVDISRPEMTRRSR